MTVTHDTLVARRGLEIGIAPQDVSDFRLERVREQGTRTVTQNLSQRIAESSRLSQLDDVTVVHGVSLLWWRSGGSNTPTIRRLTPSCRHQLPRIAPGPSAQNCSGSLPRLSQPAGSEGHDERRATMDR